MDIENDLIKQNELKQRRILNNANLENEVLYS